MKLKKVVGWALLACACALPALSFAAGTPLDVSGVTDGLDSGATGITTVGTEMLVVAGAGIGVKWLLGFLFG